VAAATAEPAAVALPEIHKVDRCHSGQRDGRSNRRRNQFSAPLTLFHLHQPHGKLHLNRPEFHACYSRDRSTPRQILRRVACTSFPIAFKRARCAHGRTERLSTMSERELTWMTVPSPRDCRSSSGATRDTRSDPMAATISFNSAIRATFSSGNLALRTQQVPFGAGIPIHRHFEYDKAQQFMVV